MTDVQEQGGTAELDQLQPDGNFRDDPLTPEQIAALKRYEDLPTRRQANRVGPRHPAHPFHAQWRADHGRAPLNDQQTEP